MDDSLNHILTLSFTLVGGLVLVIFFNIYRDRIYQKLVAETGVAATPLLRTTWCFSVVGILIGWFGMISGILLVISHLKGRVQSRSEVELARISLVNTLWSFVAVGLTFYWVLVGLDSSG